MFLVQIEFLQEGLVGLQQRQSEGNDRNSYLRNQQFARLSDFHLHQMLDELDQVKIHFLA